MDEPRFWNLRPSAFRSGRRRVPGRARGRAWRRGVQSKRAAALLRPNAIGHHHQPIVDVRSAEVHAYEALMRPTVSGLGDPLSAFHVAESAGVASRLDLACMQAALSGAGSLADGARLFVNASPMTLLDGTLDPNELGRWVSSTGAAPERVVIELTEHAAVDDLAALGDVTGALRGVGFGLALDDAGAGNNSLERIARLRPDYVKIDRSLVAGCDRDQALRQLVEVLASFGRMLGAQVVAEGVETLSELHAVSAAGADLAQGYVIARPSRGCPPVAAATTAAIVGAGGGPR